MQWYCLMAKLWLKGCFKWSFFFLTIFSDVCFSTQNNTADWTNQTNATSSATEFWEYVDEQTKPLVLKTSPKDSQSIIDIHLFSSQTTSAGHLRGDGGDRQRQVGGAVVPNCYVDQLLLLCLERGQVYRKGIYIILKTGKYVHFKMAEGSPLFSRWCILLRPSRMWCCSFFWSEDSLFLGLYKECCFIFCPNPRDLLTLRYCRCSVMCCNSVVFRWTHRCFVWTGLDGGWGSGLLFIQCGCGHVNCAWQLQHLQQQLLQVSICK